MRRWSAPYRNLGLIEYEASRSKRALHFFRKTVALEPTSADTYCDMGTAHLELGEHVAALTQYRVRGSTYIQY